MTVTPRVLRQAKLLEDTQTTQYTSTGLKTLIDGTHATNVTASPAVLSVNIVPVGGSADSSNLLLSRTLAAGAVDMLPELRGRRLDAGDFVSTDTDTANAISFRMEGRQITSP